MARDVWQVREDGEEDLLLLLHGIRSRGKTVSGLPCSAESRRHGETGFMKPSRHSYRVLVLLPLTQMMHS
ncbi:hypothetical protein O3P69_001687 [Scylla paramamosain]|uniref:Uncharacterized protein n=1 Tax=Scylla paramamosain TaxID=85552 RepID=A0AAW0UZX2_SCYPA